MKMYSDGIEEELRESLGLASQGSDPAPIYRPPEGDAEIGPEGHRAATTTRGKDPRASQPYVPLPARGIQPQLGSGT